MTQSRATSKKFNYKTLIEYLTDKFQSKVSGEPFTHQDIQQYLRRGKLPKRYGGNSISIKEVVTGTKIIILKESK